MSVDNTTEPRFISLTVEKNTEYLKQLAENAVVEGLNYDGIVNLLIGKDEHSWDPIEYYFDPEENEINLSGTLISSKGKTHIYLTIPLSDEVLIDILTHSIKKLNKLKTAIESLK